MSQTITISDELYTRLEDERRAKGLGSVAQLVEQRLSAEDEETRRRHEAVDRIEALQRRFSAKYGMMPDSADLVREDRER